jgi:hypothetical protein
MLKSIFFLFIALALASVYIQIENLGIRQITTPSMAAVTAICAAIGLIKGKIKANEGAMFIAAWALAACGDVCFELSRLSAAPEDIVKYYMAAVVFFLVGYLIFGISFNIFGAKARPGMWMAATAVLVSIAMGVVAYLSLSVPPGQGALIVVYTAQGVILLCGGLLCLMSGRYHFAAIAILLFLSDWVVGMKDFGNPDIVPLFVKEHAFILIVVTYYLAMMASIDYSFKLGGREK